MKKRTLCVLLSITAIGVILLSGCTNQTTNNNTNNTPTQETIHDEFATNAAGGSYDLANGLVHFDVPENAIQQQITLTVDSVDDPPYDTDIVLINCYSFGPAWTMFNDNINLTLQYDPSKIPSNISTSILNLFSIPDQETSWSKIQNCVVDTTHQTVTGPILHFSMIGVGYNPKDHPQSDHNQNNSSAIITFEVPVQLFEYESSYAWPSHPQDVDYTYYCGAYIAWEPQPYVRYYAVTTHYNGNPSHNQSIFSYCYYPDWGKTECPLLPRSEPDGKIVFLGPYELVPSPNPLDYYGLYTLSSYFDPIWGIDLNQHGMSVSSIDASFDYYDGWTRAQMDTIEKEAYEFLQKYVQGWTYTVEPFT